MRFNLHCAECGRFTSKDELAENVDFCAECWECGVDDLLREEALLDPRGPAGDGSRIR